MNQRKQQLHLLMCDWLAEKKKKCNKQNIRKLSVCITRFGVLTHEMYNTAVSLSKPIMKPTVQKKIAGNFIVSPSVEY